MGVSGRSVKAAGSAVGLSPRASRRHARKAIPRAAKESIQPSQVPLSEIELTPEFRRALDLLEGTSRHVYITGRAGTGKSTLLRLFRERTKKRVAVVAPTGVAAINVGGQTIHSFLRLPPRFLERDDVHTAGKHRTLVEKLDTLIIDEVSMVRADLMAAIDWSLRLNRRKMETPFGGIQMAFFGDLYQLPPVVDEEVKAIFQQRHESPFFFSASVFNSIELHYLELTRVFRQTDEAFVSLLNRIRDDQCSADDLERLNRRVMPGDSHEGSAVTLTTTNQGAFEINQKRLHRIAEPPCEYRADISGTFNASAYPADEILVLKRGAQVMLLRNDPGKRWVNGSIGRVSALTKDGITVSIGERDYAVPRVRWEKIQYKWDPETETVERDTVGIFEQYPIKLAWAITIHKSQGQTLTDVIIDMQTGAFAHGQLYVALSRCRSLSGVRLRAPVRRSDIIFDARVLEFRKRSLRDAAGTSTGDDSNFLG